MAKETLPQIALVFQNFHQQIKDLEIQLATAHESCRQLRVALHDVMLEVAQDYRSLLRS